MIDKLESLEKKYNDIQKQMSSNEVLNDYEKLKTLNEELKKITPIVEKYKLYKNIQEQIKQNEELLKDNELKELAKEEIKDLQTKSSQLIDELKIMLLPKDPLDEKDIILEIRAGTGGEEAALFAQDLFRMYVKYAENHNFKVEILEKSLSDAGGIKEIIANVKGKGAYSKFKFESGTHRVQRIPITESQGRIHTSAATVAVLPEADEIEVNINPDDLRIDVYRSSGSGGQHVNTTDSAVRITHIPTGIVVTCQDEKSQYKNKEKAMKILYARLSDFYRSQQESRIAKTRKAQVGSGDRSERIRTYNFPQGRVTDHRINLTLYKLDQILEGELDELIESLLIADQTKKLTQMEG
ncbi:peptide chain release factor 1 [Desulfurella multipotens]|uniref:Peptide chain release factor 1 n=1 Tax=Desulfurella multipotens TaxID=79269 RepID=A0A1G6HW44_9BACT|nr:peptide chain release factor 1 [Desulfurella multipotens]SDB98424.1 peptide chain release factor 1 [Desulfurella multipotens]